MNQQEILDYNRRGAEFLGWKFSKEYESFDEFYGVWEKQTDGVWYKESDLIERVEWYREYYVKVNNLYLKDYNYSLKFHSDYNWIMEIIKKILDISNKTENWDWYDRIIESITSIEDISVKINQFLIWYNEQRT